MVFIRICIIEYVLLEYPTIHCSIHAFFLKTVMDILKLFYRSDPDPSIKGWQANNRGLSYTFGPDVVLEMCQKLDIDLIARAHQVVQVL